MDKRERVARAIWDTLGSDYTFDEAHAGKEKATHTQAIKWVFDVADAAIEALEAQVKAADALVEAGNIMARALEGDYIVPGSANKWNAALAAYRATKEGGA